MVTMQPLRLNSFSSSRMVVISLDFLSVFTYPAECCFNKPKRSQYAVRTTCHCMRRAGFFYQWPPRLQFVRLCFAATQCTLAPTLGSPVSERPVQRCRAKRFRWATSRRSGTTPRLALPNSSTPTQSSTPPITVHSAMTRMSIHCATCV